MNYATQPKEFEGRSGRIENIAGPMGHHSEDIACDTCCSLEPLGCFVDALVGCATATLLPPGEPDPVNATQSPTVAFTAAPILELPGPQAIEGVPKFEWELVGISIDQHRFYLSTVPAAVAPNWPDCSSRNTTGTSA